MKNTTILLVILFSIPSLFSQNLIKDINTAGLEGSSRPSGFFPFKNGFIFSASTSEHGIELWYSDETANNTRLIKEIRPGLGFGPTSVPFSSDHIIGDTLYFMGNDGEWGWQIWRTDGTEAGTFRISSIPEIANEHNLPFTVYNNELYFAFNKENSLYKELWKGNVQVGNFQLVKDSIYSYRQPLNLYVAGSFLYFHTDKLWRTDGSQAGTIPLINDAGFFSLNSNTSYTFGTEFQNKLYLPVYKNGSTSLYESDGTVAGTQEISTLSAGVGRGVNSSLSVSNGSMYFAFGDYDQFILYKSDGTQAGTSLITDIDESRYYVPSRIKATNNYVYFSAPLNFHTGLYRYDIQASQIEVITPLNSFDEILQNGAIGWIEFTENDAGILSMYFPYFRNRQSIVITPKLWRTDGTAAGTYDLQVETVNYPILSIGNNFYFGAQVSGLGNELYQSDSTASSVSLVKNIEPNLSSASGISFSLNNEVFPLLNDGINGWKFWKTDGSSSGTTVLKDIQANAAFHSFSFFGKINGKVLFSAHDGNVQELWMTDGTSIGTTIQDLTSTTDPSLNSSEPQLFTKFGNHVYFAAHRNKELWRSDGTVQGTELVTLLQENVSSDPERITHMVAVNGELFIHADGLWKTNGSIGNKELIASIPSMRTFLYEAGNLAYFIAKDSLWGYELWRSDGTASGTFPLKDAYPGIQRNSRTTIEPQGFTSLGNELIFFQNDATHGRELWKTDGTTNGTQMVMDIFPGPVPGILDDTNPETATLNQYVFFTAKDSIHGMELWKTDGTSNGTQMVHDIQPGEKGSLPHNLWVDDSTLYFTAYEASTGVELWSTDGTSTGTQRLTDINPGRANTNPKVLGKAGTRLIFSAVDADHGFELWTFNLSTGITKPLLNDPTVSIYPNPSSDKLHIEWKKAQQGDLDLIIRNMEGKLVQQKRLQVSSDPFNYVISLKEFAAGVYTLELKTPASHLVQKFIKN